MRRISYSQSLWPFAQRMSMILGPLGTLHEKAEYPLATRESDQRTRFHEAYYDVWDAVFYDLASFVRMVVIPFLQWNEDDTLYQRIPTLRVHLPNNKAVGEWHTDKDYGHVFGELTCWMPLTAAWGSNTLHVESQPFSDDHSAVGGRPGDLVVFDGVRLSHGNYPNETDWTRVSVDLRVVKRSSYKPTSEKTVNGMPWSDYWCEL